MTRRWLIFGTVLLATLVASATELLAQSSPVPESSSPSYAELLDRLEKTERRLAELEADEDKSSGLPAAELGELPIELQGLPEDLRRALRKELQEEREEDQLEEQLKARFGPELEGLPEDIRANLTEGLPAAGLKSLSEELREELLEEQQEENFREQLLKIGRQLGQLGPDLRTAQAIEAERKGAPTVIVGGRTQIDYITFPYSSQGIDFFDHPDPASPQFGVDPENKLMLRRLRLSFQGYISDRMIYKATLAVGHPDEFALKDAYIGWYLPGNRTLLLGQSKMPFGLNSWSSNRFVLFMERPGAVRAFNKGERRFGIRMQGYRDDLTMSWQYGLYEMQNTLDLGRYIGDSFQPILYGRIATTPWYDEASEGRGYLHLGMSGSIGKPDGDTTPADSNLNAARFYAYPNVETVNPWVNTLRIRGANLLEQGGLELALNVGAFHLAAEYLGTWVQRDETTLGTGPNTVFHGGYMTLAYFLTPGDFVPWEREMGELGRVEPQETFFLIDRALGEETDIGAGWGAWQIKARYGYVDLSDADVLGGVQDQFAFGLNWYWNAHARMMFDVTRGFINNHRSIGGFQQGDYWNMGTRFMVDF